MPLANHVYAQITVRMACVLALVAAQHTQEAIAERLDLAPRTVRNDIEHSKELARCESQRELGRWWLENRLGWLLWLMEQVEIDRREVAG
jgi:DNA-binding CsgD family transcriptional regulator